MGRNRTYGVILILLLFFIGKINSQTIYYDISELRIIESGNINFFRINNSPGVLNYDLVNRTLKFETEFKSFIFKINKVDKKDNYIILYCNKDYKFAIFEDYFLINKVFFEEKIRILFEEKFYYIGRRI